MNDTEALRLTAVPSCHDIAPEDWDALVGDDNPFVEHAFFAALEDGDCLGERSGWIPQYLAVRRGEQLVGLAPSFVRTNSYGEYIFDWAWANGARRGGLRYYPKITVAVPFTPATGPRMWVHPDDKRGEITELLGRGVQALAEKLDASSTHWLFTPEAEAERLAQLGHQHRLSTQYHWHNQGFSTFEDYLGAMKRKRRKESRRERKKAQSHGLTIDVRTGAELTEQHWDALYRFYRSTVDMRGGIPYLDRGFFERAAETLQHRVVAVLACEPDGRPVAGTLNFRKGDHLYGRYWGAERDYDCLHFECCYYRLIEYAIDEGITLFEAGAQGRHKIPRGFLPVTTHSAHWIRHPGLSRAIAEFIDEEAAHVRQEVRFLMDESPYQT